MWHYFKVCEVSGRRASGEVERRQGVNHRVVGVAGRSFCLVWDRVWEGFLM